MITFIWFKSNILMNYLEGNQYLNPAVHYFFIRIYLNYEIFKSLIKQTYVNYNNLYIL